MRARGHAQPPPRQDRRPRVIGEGAGGRPDRAAVLRHLAVAAGVGAPGRRADPASSSRSVILDVERFVDTIVRGRVGVLQVVPSYLEVVLSYLEQHPRKLPDLRCVSVTGEALKKELVAALVRRQPGDQAGQRLRADRDLRRHQPRGHGRGRPRATGSRSARPCPQRARRTSSTSTSSPVPLGAPGEIVFSGVCVGRGYVNDPERTRRAFMADPHRPGERLYRGGDYGRWLPGRQAGVPRPPGHPGQDPRLPDRDRRDRERPAARPGCPRRARWWWPSGPTRASTWWPSTPARGRSRSTSCGTGWVRRCRTYMVPSAFHWRRRPAADRERQDRSEGAHRARRRARRGRAWAPRRRARRPSSSWRPPGRRCSACARTRSAGGTTSSTWAARRCRR